MNDELLDPTRFDPARWHPIETLPRGKTVAGLTTTGKVVIGRKPAAGNYVRDSNTVACRYTKMRYPCTHWSLVENVARKGAPPVYLPTAKGRP